MTFILALLAKLLARPALLVGVVSAVALGGMALKGKIERSRHEKERAALVLQIKDAQLQAKAEREARLILEQDRDDKVARIREQNDAITSMALKAQQLETTASIEAVRAFNRGRESAAALRQPTTTVKPGSAEMNAWLQQTFGSQP